MIQPLSSLLRIRAGEGRLVILLGSVLMLNTLALEMGDVVAVAGFLGSVSAPNILLLWIIDMILIIAVGSVQSLVVDRFNRLRLLRAFCLLFAGVFGGLAALFAIGVPETLNYGLLFLLVEQQNIFFPLVFWVLATELFSAAQSRRLFPVIASWSALGQVAGLSLAAAAPFILHQIHASNILVLLFNMVLYLISWALLTVGLPQVTPSRRTNEAEPRQSWRTTVTRGWDFIRRIEALRYMTLVTFCVCIVLTIIDYHFLSTATFVFASQPDGSFQTFYAIYRLIMAIIVIVTQNLVSNRLMERYGVKNALLAAPVIALVGILAVILAPGLLVVAVARALMRLINSSTDLPAQKAFLALMPEDVRGAVSIFTDGYIFAGAAILASILMGAVLIGASSFGLSPETIYLVGGLLFAVVGVITVRAMYKTYDAALFNWRLKRRQHTSSVVKELDF